MTTTTSKTVEEVFFDKELIEGIVKSSIELSVANNKRRIEKLESTLDTVIDHVYRTNREKVVLVIIPTFIKNTYTLDEFRALVKNFQFLAEDKYEGLMASVVNINPIYIEEEEQLGWTKLMDLNKDPSMYKGDFTFLVFQVFNEFLNTSPGTDFEVQILAGRMSLEQWETYTDKVSVCEWLPYILTKPLRKTKDFWTDTTRPISNI
ncbi:MAG: hypothetical protein M0R77_00125 [Gammaproteobacteria bacterium]|nr:hypothetical protein [Acholeplasmataceae bacterium]MCK9528960.1 hypothetical protein [Gammaproteobacteria bacterium]